MFLLRSIDPTHHQELWRLFDSMILDTFTNILGSSVIDQQWALCQLPVSMGGLLPPRKIDIYLSSATLLLNTKVQEELTQEETFVKIDLKLQSVLDHSLTDMQDKVWMA